MSFNLRTDSADDGLNNWDRRKKLAINRIRTFRPDLLGVQECRESTMAAYLKAELSEYHLVGVQRGGQSDTSQEMSAILYRTEAFTETRSHHFWLSDTPDMPGSLSWGADFPRTVTEVRLREQASGFELVFFNTHFDYVPTAATESARLLRKMIQGRKDPLILAGDYNMERACPEHRLLCGVDPPASPRLVDTYQLLHPEDEGGTAHDYGRHVRPMPIDWILVSRQFEVLAAEVDRYHEGELFPSDHYPIMAVISYKQPNH